MEDIMTRLFHDKTISIDSITAAISEMKTGGDVSSKIFENNIFLKQCHTLVTRLFEFSDVPEFMNREDARYNESDFLNVAHKAVVVMELILSVLKKLQTDLCVNIIKSIYEHNAGYFLVIILSHYGRNMWTSDASIQKSLEMRKFLLDIYALKSFEDMLVCELRNATLTGYSSLLKLIQKRFTKETWKRNPSSVSVYVISVKMVTYPHLSEYTDRVIPPSLVMSDDYVTENKIEAVRCLEHIMSNVTATELVWQGRIHVIFDALKNDILLRKCKLTACMLPCVLRALGVMEKNLKRYDTIDHCPKHHELFSLILSEATMESRWDMRRVYIENIQLFVDRMGLHTLRHSTALVTMVRNYLEVRDYGGEITRLRTLRVVSSFITECWPRIQNHCAVLLELLLKLLYEISNTDSGDTKHCRELLDTVLQCLLKLRGVCPDVCTETFKSVSNLNCNEKFCDYLSHLL